MELDRPKSALSYFIAEKSGVSIVSLVGTFGRGTEGVLASLWSDIAAQKCSYVILSFRDVNWMEKDQIPHFVKLQKQIREKPAELFLCSLHPDIRKFLFEQDVVIRDEMRNNLAEALQTLIGIEPN